MTETQQQDQDVRDPNTGEAMVVDKTQGSKVHEARLTRDVGMPHGGARVLEEMRAKERTDGVLYINPRTGYQMRVGGDGEGEGTGGQGGERGGDRDEARGRGGEGSTDARRAELERQLRELDPAHR